jgi:hypothetical protein
MRTVRSIYQATVSLTPRNDTNGDPLVQYPSTPSRPLTESSRTTWGRGAGWVGQVNVHYTQGVRDSVV